jgi:pyruvate dehydrogenase E2 component (dihydrolipoyllysine-residue acetyltransferase)
VPFEFRLPDLGEGIHEAQLLRWKVQPGQQVAAFAPLCEVESAKAAVELTSPVAGRIVETRFAEGDTAHLGDVLVVLETSEPSVAEPSQSEEEYFGIVGTPPARKENAVRAAPFVRKLARERGIRLEDVSGSGPAGRVRISDLETRTPPISGMRRAIAEHMLEAWRNAPQVTSMDLFDVTELVRAREALVPRAAAEGVRLTYLPFFVRAVVAALQQVPEVNATMDGNAVRPSSEYHIGIATAIEAGLVVPVVRHADRLNLIELAREIERLTAAARDQRALPAELTGGTFTITSFGGLPGSPLFATPILNYPQVGILGLGRIDLQPRVVDGQVMARQCIGVSFTFDHRAIDGETAGRFMAALKPPLELPLHLLLTLR